MTEPQTIEHNEEQTILYRAFRWTMQVRDARGGDFEIKPVLINKARIKYEVPDDSRRVSRPKSFIQANIMLMRGAKDEMGSLEPLHQGLMQCSSYEVLLCCYDGKGNIIDKVSYICSLKKAVIDVDQSSLETMVLRVKFKIKTAKNKEDAILKADHEFILKRQEETSEPS